MSAAKEKPVCVSHSGEIVQGDHPEVQLPQQHGQGQCQVVVCQPLQPLQHQM